MQDYLTKHYGDSKKKKKKKTRSDSINDAPEQPKWKRIRHDSSPEPEQDKPLRHDSSPEPISGHIEDDSKQPSTIHRDAMGRKVDAPVAPVRKPKKPTQMLSRAQELSARAAALEYQEKLDSVKNQSFARYQTDVVKGKAGARPVDEKQKTRYLQVCFVNLS